jgi:L-2-hydroxyglutarate oxidase LhgO
MDRIDCAGIGAGVVGLAVAYPVPEAGGRSAHLTLDLGSQARFGPDVEWLDTPDKGIDYSVDPRRADKFYQVIRSYWPALGDGSLQPAYSDVRPKITAPNLPAADFQSSHQA